MDNSSKKTWIMSALIILAAVLGYYVLMAGKVPDSVSTLQATNESNLVGAQVLSMLNQIRSLQIDNAFFQSQAYTSLTDYSVQVPPLPVGRPNPFAPVPGLRTSTQSTNR